MTVYTQPNRSLSQLWVCGCSVAAFLVLGLDNRGAVQAQGLSGPPQRLEETLGSGSGGPQAAGGSQSRGPQGSGSSGPPAGYGGPQGSGSSGPPAGYGDEDDSMDMMDMEASYGGSGPPSSRGRSRGLPTSEAMQAYGSSLTSLLNGLDLSPMFAPTDQITIEAGPVLQAEADQAFQAGNLGLARELMFGHMVAEYKDAIPAIHSVKYSALLRRPVWNIRFGLSMAIRGDDLLDPNPIREGANPGGMRMARGGPGGGFEDFETAMEDTSMDDEMNMEMEQEMEMEMERSMGGGPGGMSGRRGPTARRTNAPVIPTRSMLDAEAGERLNKTLGLVAAVTAEQLSKRFQEGNFGPLFSSITAPAAAASNPRGGRALSAQAVSSPVSESLNAVLNEAVEPLPMWKPGIVFIGEGASNEMIPLARAANLDLLLHFDVVLKPARNGFVQNISRLRLLNVSTGKSIGVSKGMDSGEAAQLAAAGRMGERAYVEEKLGYLFAILDREVKVQDLPNVTADVARRRIASLIASPQSRTLRTLAEIRLYQARDLITETEVEAAFHIIGSVDGLMLLHGPLNERLAMAHQWAIDSQPELDN